MYMVREVLSCNPGKVNALVQKFKALNEVMEAMELAPFRMYTDFAAERFWTLILEHDYGSLDEIAELEANVMADERAQSAMAGYHELVASGRRELYNVVS